VGVSPCDVAFVWDWEIGEGRYKSMRVRRFVDFSSLTLFWSLSMTRVVASREITLGSVLGLAARKLSAKSRNISHLVAAAALFVDNDEEPTSEFFVMVTS